MTETTTPFWQTIKTLLHQHDCVIVPGFGGFVCNKESAKIDQVSHIITPPSRKVVFNQNLKNNDGLLATHIADAEKITYSQAISQIEVWVNQIIETLEEKKSLSIDLFGNFRLNAEANYVFLPDKRNNYLQSSFGLNLIQAHPVAARSIKPNKARIFNNSKTLKPARPIKNRNIWPVALTATLVVLLSVNGYIFLSNHSAIESNNTMSITSWFDSIFNKPEQIQQHIEKPVPKIVESENTFTEVIPAPPSPIADSIQVVKETKPQSNLDLYAPLYAFASHYGAARTTVYFPSIENIDSIEKTESSDINTIVNNPTIEDHTNHEALVNTENIEKGYYVIGGVFCKERNARRFLASLTKNGYSEAQVLMNTNIHCKRVSYKKFSSRSAAEQLCSSIKSSDNQSAWVLAVE